jgi:Lon protease-like protein
MQSGAIRDEVDLPETLPILTATDVLFPRGILRLGVREPSEIELTHKVIGTDRLVGVVQSNEDDPSHGPTSYRTGCLGRVKQFTDEEDGSYTIKLRGLLRFAIMEELRVETPYRQCRVNFEPFVRDLSQEEEETSVNREAVLNTLDRFIAAYPQRIDWESICEASNEVLLNGLAMQGPFSPAEKQALLEAPDLKARAEILISLLEFEVTKAGGPNDLQPR